MLNDLLRGVSLIRSLRDRRKVRRATERYLDSLHYTLYAYWDISKPERKAQAAEWLTDQVINVLDEMGGNHE